MVANTQTWKETMAHTSSVVELRSFEKVATQRVTPTLPSAQAPLLTKPVDDRRETMIKRLFDVAVCLLAMPVALPMMMLVALAIKLDTKGGLLFRQTRVGQYGKLFTCYKFRSMRIDAEEIKKRLMAQNEATGPVFKMKRDPRITRVGRIIRKLSLDELPQLFNVLQGHMSLVGPRPAIPSEVVQYTPEQVGRLAVIPGLTGLQQVSGRSDLDFEQWVEFDLQYIREKGLLKDIEILLRTVPAVISGKGAY